MPLGGKPIILRATPLAPGTECTSTCPVVPLLPPRDPDRLPPSTPEDDFFGDVEDDDKDDEEDDDPEALLRSESEEEFEEGSEEVRLWPTPPSGGK